MGRRRAEGCAEGARWRKGRSPSDQRAVQPSHEWRAYCFVSCLMLFMDSSASVSAVVACSPAPCAWVAT